MDIYVNQSWKIEQTSNDTKIAAVKGRDSFVVILDRRLKRQILQNCRYRFSCDKNLYVRMFGAGVFLAIKPLYARGDKIIIDLEYPGHERRTIRHITSLIIRHFRHVPRRQVLFTMLGKKSATHFVARNPEYASKGYITINIENQDVLLKAMNLT